MFTLVLPFHNEIEQIKFTLEKITPLLSQYKIEQVILAHNGTSLPLSTIRSELKGIETEKKILLVHDDNPGLGVGYRLGIKNATTPYLILSACDLPFGLSDLEAAKATLACSPLSKHSNHHFIIGSKAHPESQIKGRTPLRRVMSQVFYLLRVLLLGFKTPKDSQGTIIISTELAKRLERKTLANNYIFSLELATHFQNEQGVVEEVPVIYKGEELKESSIRLFSDSLAMIKSLIALRARCRSG